MWGRGDRTKVRLALAVLSSVIAVIAAPATAREPGITGGTPIECDRLAGLPPDSRRTADGVGFPGLDAAKALPACAKDLAADPNNPRLQFESGRANEKAGNLETAAKLYQAAAGQAYPAAQVGLATFYWRGAGGLSRDLDEADRLLKLAIAAREVEARE